MRGVYQSADHPERMQLVFTTQLHHQLQTLARGREVPPPPPPLPVADVARRFAHGHAHGHATRAREVNGWELEKKVVVLKELRPLLEKPFFLYAESGGGGAAAAASPTTTTSSSSSSSSSSNGVAAFFSMDSYFNKTLPLVMGQTSLLDVWEYLLDMCEFVPVRNRSRSLYLHVAACICRRVEFIRGYAIENEPVVVSDDVRDRFYDLLARCLALCNAKLTQSRILLEENALFMAHVYSTVCMRFPGRVGGVFDALVEATRVVEDAAPRATLLLSERVRSRSEPLTAHSFDHGGGSRVAQRAAKEKEQCRSPRETLRHWNGLTDFERRSSEIRPDERVKGIFSAFSKYKQTRRAHAARCAGSDGAAAHGHPQRPTQADFSRRTVESSLCQALEADMARGELIAPTEAAFIQKMPILHVFSGGEKKLLHHRSELRRELELGLTLFTERLQQPARDDVLLVYFVGAFLSDRHYWCDAALASTLSAATPHGDGDGDGDGGASTILWHCLPGYFCVVRAFVALFKRMCQRRQRMTSTSQATVGNILSIVHGRNVDLWASYWTTREILTVIDTFGEVVRNPRLVDVFVEIVLEGTNILDPASANYSLSILQRVMDAAAAAQGPSPAKSSLRLRSGDGGGKVSHRGCLSDSFDDAYFCGAMRKALLSSHVQILLKALTFLYSCLDLLPSRGRRRIISELVIRENFFRLYLHWNDEIRKIYSYIIVFKIFASNRLDLPCASDQILLARSPFFHSHDAGGAGGGASMPSSATGAPSFGYWSHLSEIAQSMLKSPSPEAKEEQRRAAAANGLANLIAWDPRGATLINRSSHRPLRRDSLFRASLDDDDISVDLLVASKLDASLKMLADQIGRKNTTPSQYFPVEQEAYADRALAQHVNVLWEYYTAAFDRPPTKPAAPKLEFTITSPLSAD